MSWIQIWPQFTFKFDRRPDDEGKVSFQKTWFPKVIQYTELEIYVCPGIKPIDHSAGISRVTSERVVIELTWQKQAWANYLLPLRHRTLPLDNNLQTYQYRASFSSLRLIVFVSAMRRSLSDERWRSCRSWAYDTNYISFNLVKSVSAVVYRESLISIMCHTFLCTI